MVAPRRAVVGTGQPPGSVCGKCAGSGVSPVKTGKEFGEQMEILSGLAAGEHVATSQTDDCAMACVWRPYDYREVRGSWPRRSLLYHSKLTPLVIVSAIRWGASPSSKHLAGRAPDHRAMMDVFVEMPGATGTEIGTARDHAHGEPLWEIPGVEYIYSTTRPGLALAIVRFKVGEKEEDSIVQTL